MKMYQKILGLLLVPSALLLAGCQDDSNPQAENEKAKPAISHNSMKEGHKKDEIVRKDPRRTLLEVAGLGQIHASAKQVMATYLEPVLVDIKQGTVTTDPEAISAYRQQVKAHQVPTTRMAEGSTFAGLNARPDLLLVYLVKQPKERINSVVFPVEGHNSSLLKGYLALDIHDWHINNILFYQQGETPSLGGRIMTDNAWLSQFDGKQIYQQGQPAFKVITKHETAVDEYSIDGISGATHTSQTVQHIINDWMGPKGFDPILPKLQKLALHRS